MGKDVEWKTFFHDNSRYADIINGIGCGGAQLVKDSDLQEEDPTERKKSRDLLRRVAFGVNFAIIGIENQDKVDYKFPLRNMHYDISRYHRQASAIGKEIKKNSQGLLPEEYLSRFKKDSKLKPLVTFILYAGEKEWDGATCLYDMLDFTDIPDSLKNMVSDCKINIIDICRLKDTSVFQTDVRQVFDFIRCSEEEDKLVQLVESDSYYQHMEDDAFEVVTKYTDSTDLIGKEEYKIEGGKHNVCKAIRDLIQHNLEEGRESGLKEGRESGLKEGHESGVRFVIENMIKDGMSDEDILRITQCTKEVLEELKLS